MGVLHHYDLVWFDRVYGKINEPLPAPIPSPSLLPHLVGRYDKFDHKRLYIKLVRTHHTSVKNTPKENQDVFSLSHFSSVLHHHHHHHHHSSSE